MVTPSRRAVRPAGQPEPSAPPRRAGTGRSAIAVGYDGSPDAQAALQWAAAIAARTGMALRVVHAVGLLEHAGMAAGPARDTALALAADAGLEQSQVQWRQVDGEPASVLVREVERGVELLVVGTRGFWGHPGALGSTSLELAERSPVPVVIVPRGGHRS